MQDGGLYLTEILLTSWDFLKLFSFVYMYSVDITEQVTLLLESLLFTIDLSISSRGFMVGRSALQVGLT